MNRTRHDIQLQTSMLQQCLSGAEKPIAFFLGAGCPAAIRSDKNEPLIPDIAGITCKVHEELAEHPSLNSTLATATHNLRQDGNRNPTVEDLLTHIRSLSAVAGVDTVRGLSADQLDRLDFAICNLIYDIANKDLPHRNTPYHRLATWANSIPRSNPIEIFTTNHDLLVEQALEESRVPYFDGFSGVRRPMFDPLAIDHDATLPLWTRIWKLHGSINWYQDDDDDVFRGTIHETAPRRVIHPSHLKYHESRRMPYLAMLDRLREFLKNPTAAVVFCGFSFGDAHINEIIAQSLQHTSTTVAFALQFGDIDDYPNAKDLAKLNTNMNVLARDGAVIGGRIGSWQEQPLEGLSWTSDIATIWSPVDPNHADGIHQAELKLGDFTALGSFLDRLVDGQRLSNRSHQHAT